MQYDYIIVGAGAAGCVLANELSKGTATVLLLEAGGPDRNPNIKIPAAFSKLFESAEDWNYRTVPQEELGGRELYWPRGKVLGGSTSMNAMIYQRGHRATFDMWAADGCEGWSYQDMLSIFIRQEDQQRGASSHHGAGGPLSVSDLRDVNPLTSAFVDSAVAAGFPHNADFNGESQDGFGLYQVTQKRGVRNSAATAFLKPVLRRKNLTAVTRAHVTRVVIEGDRAVAVEYIDKSGEQTASATSEIILSGGAVNSPQLLMLSGVGPASHLRDHGIDVVADSPAVGQNLQDHAAIALAAEVNRPVSLAHAETPKQFLKYLTKREGMLSSNVGEAGGFVTLGGGPIPDTQFHFAPAYFINHGFDSPESDGLTIAPVLVDVKSRGEIRLQSAKPTDAPLIDPRYLSDPEDLRIMVEGIKLARQIAARPPIAEFITSEFLPGAHATSEADLQDFVREYMESLYHPVGTCAMGAGYESVVDPQLRVRGVQGLRVADASIMPTIVNANTQAASMAIGGRAAEWIRAGA
ncbi:MAG: choline dehydrogenase [Acidimicrobiales bacterium]|nr:GMC family oxidoreductase N-terminal domain-containing protein [Acidimicrobiia bacterium]NNC79557.1 choline dehydrogenase [Acidimicrobiales bacterium]RZV48609.1 MAG: choline dehydrogenase [Acidimicrobiales bacterium]